MKPTGVVPERVRAHDYAEGIKSSIAARHRVEGSAAGELWNLADAFLKLELEAERAQVPQQLHLRSASRNRWFLDTEFNDDGHTIELISIALVAEDEQSPIYYAISTEFDATRCNSWLIKNVMPHLPSRNSPVWKDRIQIAQDIRQLVGPAPEFWAYFADYDWVALCQLYGAMVDLPQGWPMYCRDLKQLAAHVEFDLKSVPKTLEHHALSDAYWVRSAFLALEKSIGG